MLKFFTELTGTLLLTFAVAYLADPLTAGLILAAAVYIGSDLSGAHFNPAVSLAAWLNRKIDSTQFLLYLTAQLTGASVAAIAYWKFSGLALAMEPSASTGTPEFLTIEILFSFLFVLMFLFMMYPDRVRKNHIFGLMIGLTFAGGLMISEPVTGSALNPALAAGFAVADYLNQGYSYYFLLIHFFAPLAGGLIAAYIHRMIR